MTDTLTKDEDYYLTSDGLMVFTKAYHLKRGHCCDSGCRHCPYEKLPPVKQKVLAYITRAKNGRTELLVFTHQGMPEAGVQVPAGTVEPGEDLLVAVRREVQEEAGLDLTAAPLFLGAFPHTRSDTHAREIRNIYHYPAPSDLPDRWTHQVTGNGEDQNLSFEFYWIDRGAAAISLAAGQGDYLRGL